MRCHYLPSCIFFTTFLIFISIVAGKTVKNTKKPRKDPVFPVTAFCENRISAFTVSDNTHLVSSSSLIYEDVTEEICLKMCSDNRDNKGRTILCASFVYDHATFVCTIFRSKSYPEGDLETEVAPGKRFFEKFCLGENIPADCADSQFLRADQSVIIGYAQNVSVATSIEDCIAQCLTEYFQCKSAMYFYKEGECITNTESAITQPTSFAREESDKVIYIQNGCPAVLAQQKLLESSTTPGTAFTKAENSGETAVSEELDSTSTPKEEANDSDTESADHSEETTAATATAAIIEQSAVKEKSNSESEEQKDEDTSEEESSSFRTDPTEPAESRETTATTIEKISKVLTRKLKKLRTNSGAVDFGDHPKSLNQKKLKQIKEIIAEEGEENEKSQEESVPLEVKPSSFLTESHVEGTSPVNVVHRKAKAQEVAQKPIKRLKIETLSGFDENDHFSHWSNWSPCKRPGERRIRRRKCYNLRKCVGALMEVGECPNTMQETDSEYQDEDELLPTDDKGPIPPALPFSVNDKSKVESGAPPGILPTVKKPESENKTPENKERAIWSPWPGVCQEFASGQPCKNHEIIGFESRDCLAIDQTRCKGPFFRYCTIPC